MPLPDHVAIGPLVFAITDDEVAHLRSIADSHNDTWGYISYMHGTIVLSPSQFAAHKRLALLHEVMHGCWHLTDREHEDDEKAILALAAPLLDTLRRNPGLVLYLMEDDDAIEKGLQQEVDQPQHPHGDERGQAAEAGDRHRAEHGA